MFHNQIKYKLGTAGFSLPGVLVGVGLLGISATIISQTVINSRRTQKYAELKLSSNKFQQAALSAVTDRVKDFVLEERCSGARWGGAGATEVEKAFSELPLTTDSGVTTSLKFTKSPDLLTGNDDVKGRCRAPVSLGALDAGEYIRFCMEITPTGSPQVDYRLLELLIVPVDLASDKAMKCSDTSGAAAGIKVTWQMYNQINNSKVSGDATDKTVLTESGIFLVSAETKSYSGTCNITAARVGTSDQCTINVSGLGRRPPTLLKNNTVVTGFSWDRAQSTNYDAFTATTTCETTQSSTFRAQSAAGSDFCEVKVFPACFFLAFDGSNRKFRRFAYYDLDNCFAPDGRKINPGISNPNDGYVILERGPSCDNKCLVIDSTRFLATQAPVGSLQTCPTYPCLNTPLKSATWCSVGIDPGCNNADGSMIYVELTDEIH